MKNLRRIATAALLLPGLAHADFIQAGRPVNPDRSFTLKISVGQVTEIEGGVTETTRQLYELEGRDPSTFAPESYTFEELGLTESEINFGFSIEKMWRYITLRGDLSYMRAEANATPPRDFYIGVDEVDFNGKSYEYMKLEEGVPYQAKLDSLLINGRMQYTPFTIAPENILSFTPWVHLGLFAIAGTFEVDQGEAKGIELYENPPREYVVGGNGEGTLVGFAPELGVGGEAKLWLGRNRHGDRELALQGTYGIFQYKGSSEALGIDSRNEKDLDIDYDVLELRALFYLPVSAKLDLVFGAEYRTMTTDAESKEPTKSLEEVLEDREKFDKDIALDLTIVNAFIGLRF